jgi:hypothetical protein
MNNITFGDVCREVHHEQYPLTDGHIKRPSWMYKQLEMFEMKVYKEMNEAYEENLIKEKQMFIDNLISDVFDANRSK